MQKKYYVVAVLVIITGTLLAFGLPQRSTENIAEAAEPQPVATDSAIAEFKWNSVMESIELQKTSKKKLFIDVYTTWCGPCKMLDANTFSNPVIRKILSEYYIPTKFNAESGDSILFKGQTFTNPNYSPQPRKSTHEFAVYIASTQNGLGYPTMVFLDEELNMIQPIAGYLTPQQLEPILVYFGTDANKTTDWPTYYAAFKSSISQ